jgi:CRISPR-associated protein Cas1
MLPLPLANTHLPPVRVMALHALTYCERLFYLEEVEELRVADDRVYAGRELHATLEADDDGERVALELNSERWGLMGKVDCVKRRDGSYLPYEHKRGRAARNQDSEAEAWASDRVQVAAYAVLLEEAFDQNIPEVRVRYHADNVTVRIPLDVTLRQELAQAIERARMLRETLERPPIATNERLCARCSLAPVCLPEEVRHQQEPSHETVRLFPPDRTGTTLHVVSQGTMVGRSGNSLNVRPREGPESKHPIRGLDAVVMHGFSQISTQALRLCVDEEVGLHWMTTSGGHIGSLVPTAGQVQRRIRQYKAMDDPVLRLRLTKALVLAKVEGQHRYLMRASRGDDTSRTKITKQLNRIQELLPEVNSASSPDSLRGLEGVAAVQYFEALRLVLSEAVPEELRFANRNRRPPQDRFNALLSYGYGLLHTAVMRAILASGLEPALGFYHTPRSAAYPLVLDVMELFRVVLWDIVIVGSLHRQQWDVENDFTVTRTKVWLSESGRRKAIALFEARLEETWKHPVLDYSLSYYRTLELEARLLEKEWTGEPGLFAQSRLR